MRADRLASQVDESGWIRCSAGDGAKGPRVYDWALVEIRPLREPGKGYWLLAGAAWPSPRNWPTTCATARQGTTLEELARVAGTQWAIEECFEEAKGQSPPPAKAEVGLDQYEVRRWDGWYRHITLVMLAHAYLAVIKYQASAQGCSRERGAVPAWMKV